MFDSCPLEAVFFHFGSASFGDPSDLATIMERNYSLACLLARICYSNEAPRGSRSQLLFRYRRSGYTPKLFLRRSAHDSRGVFSAYHFTRNL